MAAALDLPPKGMISSHTYHYLFGLLAATGLRISEALSLQCSDLVDDGLIIRNGKFGKQRLVALQPSTRQALQAYLAIRAKLGARGCDLFVSIRGRAPHKVRAHIVFVRLARQLGLRGPTGTAGMRLHDLRHTFAVRSLESCPPDREAVAHHMAGLDHVAFLLCMLLVAARLSSRLWMITGFTLGHSITLSLSVLGLVSVRSAAVEALIGYTVASRPNITIRGSMRTSPD